MFLGGQHLQQVGGSLAVNIIKNNKRMGASGVTIAQTSLELIKPRIAFSGSWRLRKGFTLASSRSWKELALQSWLCCQIVLQYSKCQSIRHGWPGRNDTFNKSVTISHDSELKRPGSCESAFIREEFDQVDDENYTWKTWRKNLCLELLRSTKPYKTQWVISLLVVVGCCFSLL